MTSCYPRKREPRYGLSSRGSLLGASDAICVIRQSWRDVRCSCSGFRRRRGRDHPGA
ncbi:Uncharacterised protein [Bordetella pertussis]|nr:Uncharacterised protein [Bordetella pertussis]